MRASPAVSAPRGVARVEGDYAALPAGAARRRGRNDRPLARLCPPPGRPAVQGFFILAGEDARAGAAPARG
ncbi:hypothetical protein Asru_0779_05 [Acidisphaera rubrifaciens HS-AP3]|uniref:Uncharacterized protein n=1 Tax=Acidisphaera rubrifaciens HS-AP3 TaxID=1231350 RepID=A0A0D6P9B1_9PROT|nr:hypothetical protein Asru_0779_05 [Acidisphaera rubrifaciens HS-AP3]